MKPPKRSTRLRRQKQTSESLPVPRERGTNTCGLPILPDELLLEILSYYPPISFSTLDNDSVNTAAHIARRDSLLALTRTCSNLRRFFRPCIWHRIEVCAGMQVGEVTLNTDTQDGMKEFALELVRQLEIVTIRDPSLAQHVNIVNVEITDFSISNVLLELARCLALFTNLHTVKLRTISWGTDAAATRAFQKYTYPQIRSVIVSNRTFPLLRSCPQVRSMGCGESIGNSFLEFARHCPLLEQCAIYFIPAQIQVISRAFPQLRDLSLECLYYRILEDDLTNLSVLTRLQTIRLHIWHPDVQHTNQTNQVLTWVKDLLLKLQRQDKEEKRIVIKYESPQQWKRLYEEEIIVLPVLSPGTRNLMKNLT